MFFIFQEELDPSLAPILNKSIIKSGMLIKRFHISVLKVKSSSEHEISPGSVSSSAWSWGGYKYSHLGGMLIHHKVTPPEYFVAFLKIHQQPFISVRREVMWI